MVCDGLFIVLYVLLMNCMMNGSGEHVPLYQKLTDYYSRRIFLQEYQPGSKIDSINKIMERHTVSRETAKLVLRRLIEKGLVVSVQGKGTFVNEITETRSAWGVVVPFFSSNVEQLISELTFEAERAKSGLHFYLHYNNHEEEIRIVGNLIQSGYEAIIVIPNYDESLTAGYYRRVISGKSKLILADNTMAGSFFSYVVQSYDLGVKRAFDYLSQKGSGNFLLLGNEIWRGQNLVFDLMESTFRMLIQQSCPDRNLLVKRGLQEINAPFIRTNSITGILSVQDSDSVRMLGRLREWGIAVPGQVSLVSYGNTELTKYFNPGITAVDCNYREMARVIAGFITGGEKISNRQVVISPDIIVRNT
jgi:DNA-binding LacI/PurR family transcriptional regulator